jgi:membrane protease subunit (stomatin/prohibitin family)
VVKASDPAVLLRQVVGTNSQFSVDQIGDQLRDLVVARFADALGESKMSVLDMAGNQDELGKFVTGKIKDDFATFGLDVVKLVVENISLPSEVEAALDKRSSMGIIGNMNAYTQYQSANAIQDAAKNPSGIAASGVGIGMGIGMAGSVMGAMGGAQMSVMPPAIPAVPAYFIAVNGQQSGPHDMGVLKAMASKGELTRETLVWRNGMVNWTAAGQVGDLAGVLGSVPPPLPK